MTSAFFFLCVFHANLTMLIIPHPLLKQKRYGHCVAFKTLWVSFITSTSTICCHVHHAWNKTVATMMECSADDSTCEQVTFQQISALYALTWWFSKGNGWQQGSIYRLTFPDLSFCLHLPSNPGVVRDFCPAVLQAVREHRVHWPVDTGRLSSAQCLLALFISQTHMLEQSVCS